LLGDLIVCCRMAHLSRQLMAWSLVKRRPWIQLLARAVVDLLPVSVRRYLVSEDDVEPWTNDDFARRSCMAARLLDVGDHFGLWIPTRRYYAGGVVRMSNKLAKIRPSAPTFEEVRYPFLDQNLIEFILSIPGEQLLRPGERRSLMRRALIG